MTTPGRVLADLDFVSKFATRNRLEDPRTSDPSPNSSLAGLVWFNTSTSKWMYCDGTSNVDPRDRTTHTGFQTASTISDLDGTIRAYRLDQLTAPNTDLSIGTNRLTNVVDPSSSQDAATKNYVDAQMAALTSGQTIKGAVTCAATTNVTLSSPGATIDGVTMAANDIVLLAAQTNASQNGPYLWTAATSPLVRADNWDTSEEAVLGSYWIVEQGTYADQYALLTNDTPITLGTDEPAFVFIGGIKLTPIAPINIANSQISLNIGTNLGLTVSSGSLVPDWGMVGRKVTGLIPSSTSGIVTVSGQNVTINHQLNNYAPQVTIAAYTSPPVGFGYVQGDLIGPGLNGFTALDANNVTGTLPGTLAANQWAYSIIG